MRLRVDPSSPCRCTRISSAACRRVTRTSVQSGAARCAVRLSRHSALSQSTGIHHEDVAFVVADRMARRGRRRSGQVRVLVAVHEDVPDAAALRSEDDLVLLFDEMDPAGIRVLSRGRRRQMRCRMAHRPRCTARQPHARDFHRMRGARGPVALPVLPAPDRRGRLALPGRGHSHAAGAASGHHRASLSRQFGGEICAPSPPNLPAPARSRPTVSPSRC